MGVYLRAKFEVSSIILTSFRLGGGVILPPPPLLPTSKRTPKKPNQIKWVKWKSHLRAEIFGPNITLIQSKSQCEF